MRRVTCIFLYFLFIFILYIYFVNVFTNYIVYTYIFILLHVIVHNIGCVLFYFKFCIIISLVFSVVLYFEDALLRHEGSNDSQ